MTKYRLLSFCLASIFLLPSPAEAQSNYFMKDKNQKKHNPYLTRETSSVSVSLGVRRNEYDWNIASDITGTQTPNIISELTWSDVYLAEIKAEYQYIKPFDFLFIDGGFQLDLEASAGSAFDGENQDSDWAGDNRTDEFSRSKSSTEGYAYGGSASIGYKFDLIKPSVHRGQTYESGYYNSYYSTYRPKVKQTVSVTPFIGYGWDEQYYEDSELVQLIPPTGPSGFQGVNAEMWAQWYGPFFGLEAAFQGLKSGLSLRGEFHDLTYDAEANWVLRADFQQDPSFEQEAEGDGVLLNAEYNYKLGSKTRLVLDATYEKREAEDGVITFYGSDGSVGRQRLNEVNDVSQSIHAGFVYNW
jgi:hypothetical protein